MFVRSGNCRFKVAWSKVLGKCTFQVTQDEKEAEMGDSERQNTASRYYWYVSVANSGAVAKRDQIVSIPIA